MFAYLSRTSSCWIFLPFPARRDTKPTMGGCDAERVCRCRGGCFIPQVRDKALRVAVYIATLNRMKPVLGVGAATLEISVAPPGPPRTYFGVAEGLMPGIRILGTSSPEGALALTLLCGHTLECILKAYLSRDGKDARVRRNGVQHNLRELWLMARGDGLDLAEAIPPWLEILSNLHGAPFFLRYSTEINALHLPPQTEMLAGVSRLFDAVCSRI
jgi:hypothetical protein